MPRLRKLVGASLCTCIMILALARNPAAAAVRYAVVNLGTLPGPPAVTSAYKVNVFGQVVGQAGTYGQIRGFLWLPHPAYGLPRGMNDLGTLGGLYASAADINDAGQAAGQADTQAGYRHAFLWTPGGTDGVVSNPQMKDLGTLGGNRSCAYGINASGRVVGESEVGDGRWHAFLWTPGGADGVASNPQMKDLGTLCGADSAAFGISSAVSACVVGWAETSNIGDVGFPIFYGFGWTANGTNGPSCNSQMSAMQGLDPIFNSVALDVADAGYIVGYADMPGPPAQHGLLWGNEHKYDLGTLGDTFSSSYAFGVNNLGQVVGSTEPTYAFLVTPEDTDGDGAPDRWSRDLDGDRRNDLMADLNAMILPQSGWTLVYAYGINDRGQISGWGFFGGFPNGQQRGFLLVHFADFDFDGDVDSADFDLFAACGSGPAIPYAQGCSDKDVDGDGDVDHEDFGIFQRCWSGSLPADPDCAG